MANSNILDILLKHDRWATGLILKECGALSADQFHRRFEMGPGSLHDTITHVLAAQRFWSDLLSGRPERPRLEKSIQRTPAELMALLDEIAGELAATAASRPLDQTITRIREGKTYVFTRAAVLTHVTTHAMHHRAQCLNMLRHIGVNPLPPSSVVEWANLADPK